MRMLRTLLLAPMVTGCALGDFPLDEVDPWAAPAAPTWSEHVQPILEFHCTACHAPDAQPGAQEGFRYDTCSHTRRGWRSSWESMTVRGDMPPGGASRLESWELLTLERWHAQGATCD